MSDQPKSYPRPLSPHLQVYKLPMTALMSISHRITGVALAGGFLLIAAFLVAAMMGESYYNQIMTLAMTLPGTILMFLWSFALYYHLCNGVRHLIWDTVHLIDQRPAFISGFFVLAFAILLTAVTWYPVFY